MIMATRIFYLMFKNTAKWNVYKVAFDKREGIHNLISHLKEIFRNKLTLRAIFELKASKNICFDENNKCLVIVKITSIISLIIFDTSYAALFYVKMEDDEEGKISSSE